MLYSLSVEIARPTPNDARSSSAARTWYQSNDPGSSLRSNQLLTIASPFQVIERAGVMSCPSEKGGDSWGLLLFPRVSSTQAATKFLSIDPSCFDL
jgi:hypothetical protein